MKTHKSIPKRSASIGRPGVPNIEFLEIWAELSNFWLNARGGAFLKEYYAEKRSRLTKIFRRMENVK